MLWLNEASGESAASIMAASEAIDSNLPEQTKGKIVRQHFPWEGLEPHLFR